VVGLRGVRPLSSANQQGGGGMMHESQTKKLDKLSNLKEQLRKLEMIYAHRRWWFLLGSNRPNSLPALRSAGGAYIRKRAIIFRAFSAAAGGIGEIESNFPWIRVRKKKQGRYPEAWRTFSFLSKKLPFLEIPSLFWQNVLQEKKKDLT
jgi:hypothetical protein